MSGRLEVVRTVAALRAAVAGWRKAGDTVGLVPTMGALHAGHLSLIAAARDACRRSIATIFVNPKQFGPREDFARYPRQEAADRAMLDGAGCDLLFAPGVEEMYPAGFDTAVSVGAVTRRWEGEARPGHFSGVATVVTKLLLQALADKAFFGEKDWQQLQAVARMARDLDIPTAIVGCPTVREADGLALSSRHAYLAPAERAAAPALHRALTRLAGDVAQAADAAAVGAAVAACIAAIAAAGFAGVDYVAAVDAETLEPLEGAPAAGRSGRILAAARLGGVRLIDNVAVP